MASPAAPRSRSAAAAPRTTSPSAMGATITTAFRTSRSPASCLPVNPRSERSGRTRRAPRPRGVVLLLLLVAVTAAGCRLPALAEALPAAAPPANASVRQGPSASWRTLITPHYRVHYPEPFEARARRRDGATAEIGYAPAEAVDVVVSDPEADANGAALPLRGWPRLVLWTTPPPPDSEIGYYRDSIEDLLAHEEAHLVHLLRPSRNPLLAGVLPGGAVAVAPRRGVGG